MAPSSYPNYREELLVWEQVYNAIRPHQALGYVTPLKFLEQWKRYFRKEVKCR
ncbi:integrase core domain-containing protein [Chloroflexota bacterium]